MTIIIGADPAGSKLKDVIKDYLLEKSYDFKDYEYLSQNAIITARQYENDYVIKKQIEIYKTILESR